MIGLSKITYFIKQSLAKNMIKLLEKHDLRNKIIDYVKHEWSNLNYYFFKLVKSCDILGLKENFQGISKLKKNPTKKYLTSFFYLDKFANKIVLF
jgi:hypothetical protein